MRKYIIVLFLVITVILSGCDKKPKEKTMSSDKFIEMVKESTGYDVTYDKDRKTVTIKDYISKDIIEGAIVYDETYVEWLEMVDNLTMLYESINSLSKEKNANVNCEFVLLDKDSYDVKKEIPVLIINEDGIVWNVVEKVKRKR